VQHYTVETPRPHEKLLLWKAAGEIHVLDLGGFETRNVQVLKLIQLADLVYGFPDFPLTLVNTGDRPVNEGDPSWRALSFSTAVGYEDVPIPDFVFDGWPQAGIGDYQAVCRELAAAGRGPAECQVVGWIGNCETNDRRWELLRRAEEHPGLFEVEHITRQAAPGGDGATARYLTLAEQVRRWAVLIDVEGVGLSGRLKLLLHSGRPVLVQERPWAEWFWPELRPWEHFVPVRRDLSDLVERTEWTLEHRDEAAQIGAAGQRLAQERMTRATALRRWADVFEGVARMPPLLWGPEAFRQAMEPALAEIGAPLDWLQ
jgi:Glycosyl transferase family 90